MAEAQVAEQPAEAEVPALPEGDYAIVECMGHRTLVGRISEVERFGTKFLAIEPLFAGELLPEVLVGGASIYALTKCTAEVAEKRQAKERYQLPTSLVATLPDEPTPVLPPPAAFDRYVDVDDDDDSDGIPF